MRHVLGLLMLSVCFVPSAPAEQMILNAAQPANGVSLPFQQHDAQGNEWLVMPGGILRLGNNQLYNEGACLKYLEQWQQQEHPIARRDDKTGELVLENLKVADIVYSRRMKFDAASGLWRVIDIFTNPTGSTRLMGFVLQSNLNHEPTGPVTEHPKIKRRALGWVGVSQIQDLPAVVEIYNGQRSRLNTTPVGHSVGHNYVWCEFALPLPAGKSAAIMHFHGTAVNVAAGRNLVDSIDDAKLLKDVSPEIRKLIVNFGAAGPALGDLELLRGDLFDQVELVGGDQLKGTLRETSYKLTTTGGVVDVPGDRVLGVFSVGRFKPRQLIVTVDGEVLGGELVKPTIDLELVSGQLTKVPLSQLVRLGYRKRAGESDGVSLDKPYVALRSGERLFVKAPESPLQFVSRYGTIAVDAAAVAAINFQCDQHGVHELTLTDGSKLAGLLMGDQITLSRESGGEAMKLDTAKLLRWQFKGVDEMESGGAFLETTTGDRFVGALEGTLRIETAFDALDVAADQVGHLARLKESPTDVQLRLWDGGVVSGRLVDAALPMKLASGVHVKVPLAAVQEYSQLAPKPPAAVLKVIEAMVKQLAADDPKDREGAEQRLLSFGPSVAPVLSDLRASQPLEAQNRIDALVKQLTEKPAVPATPATPPAEDQLEKLQELPAAPGPVNEAQEGQFPLLPANR